MFSSQRVVTKDSVIYKAWLAGVSMKALSRREIGCLDVQEMIQSILEMTSNIAIVGTCTLGIVKIYDGKMNILLADCQRAVETAKCIKSLVKNGKINKSDVIKAVMDIDNIIPEPESCYIPDFNHNAMTAPIADITMRDVLPVAWDKYNNLTDDAFGDENFEDFSQLINNIPETQPDSQMLTVGYEDFTAIENDDFNNNIADLESKVENPTSPEINDWQDELWFEEAEDVAPVSVDMFSPSEVQEYQIDTESVRSEAASSTKSRGRRRKKLVIDEEKALNQTFMRHSMDDYRDTIKKVDLAPPNRHLKRIAFEQNNKFLFKACHVLGVFSQKGPIAKEIQWLSKLASEKTPNLGYCYDPTDADVFDFIMGEETERLEEIREIIDIPLEDAKIEQDQEQVEKWLENHEEPANIDILQDVPMDIPDIPPIEQFEPMDIDEKHEEVSKPARKRKIIDESDDSYVKFEEFKLGTLRKKINKVLKENGENEITLNSMISTVFGANVSRKQAARAFMMILEMKKLKKVEISQNEPFEAIFVKVSTEE